jgi:hypothetical protein
MHYLSITSLRLALIALAERMRDCSTAAQLSEG